MRKVALLIGVSEFNEPDLKPLPNAAKDGVAIAQILQREEIGGFDPEQVIVLTNPSQSEAQDAIHQLFAQRQKDDLLLLYFSGHGVRDDRGNLYLAMPDTRKENGQLVKHTAIAAQFLHEAMSESRSEHQVLIFDCCFSGAIAKGMTVKDDGSVALDQQLGGKGRAILTSSNSIEYSFAPEDLPLSVYTHYLVEGLEKGAADLDGDGQISADELHQYVFDKVKTAAPAMTPQFFPVREGYRIFLARSPQDDPQVKYRREVQRLVNQGNYRLETDQFSVAARRYLDSFYPTLNLTKEITQEIEAEVLDPVREYQRKLQEYTEALQEILEDEGMPLCKATQAVLENYQLLLGLRDADVQGVEQSILSVNSVNKAMLQNLELIAVKTDVKVTSFGVSQAGQDSEDTLTPEQEGNYARLRDLLKAEKWREADRETFKVMIGIIESSDNASEQYAPLTDKILKFPYRDLQAINRLWVRYSQGRFGFSVQMKIYLDCGGGLDGEEPDQEIWDIFCDRVGWRKNKRDIIYRCLQFNSQFSASGELPFFFFYNMRTNEHSFEGDTMDFWLALVSYKDLEI